MIPEDEIEKISQTILKTIDSIACLTITKDEENIFHQGFYSGYRKCEERSFTKEEIESILDGFTNDSPGFYIKTNLIERLEKLKNSK